MLSLTFEPLHISNTKGHLWGQTHMFTRLRIEHALEVICLIVLQVIQR
jgi:hypothetical protein